MCFQEGRTTSPSLAGPTVPGLMAPRPEEIMETKYRETLAAIQENCPPPPHPYLDPHRPGGLLLPLPTKTEVRIGIKIVKHTRTHTYKHTQTQTHIHKHTHAHTQTPTICVSSVFIKVRMIKYLCGCSTHITYGNINTGRKLGCGLCVLWGGGGVWVENFM